MPLSVTPRRGFSLPGDVTGETWLFDFQAQDRETLLSACMTKSNRCQDRELEFVGKARPKKLGEIGFVEKKGRSRILRGEGNVEIFFPHKEDRKSIYYSKRVFLASFAEYLG